MSRLRLAAGAAAMLAAGACTNLDVTNPNNPDIERVLATPEDVRNLAVSTINGWYQGSTYYEPYVFSMVTSDNLTMNYGNFGARFNNREPREPYNNVPTSNDAATAKSGWDNNYSNLGAANDVLRAIRKRGLVITNATETDKYAQLAQFAQAAALTNIALLYDKGFVVDENIDVTATPPTLQPYGAVTTAALAKWDALITASSASAHSYDPAVFRGDMNSARLTKLANTMAAMTLAYSARTPAQAAALDYARILAYAEKGISTTVGGAPFDFIVEGDGGTSWWSGITELGSGESWMRVDQRIVNQMDPVVPAKFNGTLVAPTGAPGTDDRLGMCDAGCDLQDTSLPDIVYVGYVLGQASRGIYMQSPFVHRRYFFYSLDSETYDQGPAPYILRAENDLLIAEALVRTNGDKTRAADLINRTRVTRGGLAPIAAGASLEEFLAAIEYERDVELLSTNGLDLPRRRRVATAGQTLQTGTPRHLPVPGKELEVLQLPYYTFGGVGNPEMFVSSGLGATTSRFDETFVPRRERPRHATRKN